MDTIRDMLSVGQEYTGRWALYRWDRRGEEVVATFPREDEAWGVTSLICEYVERYDYDPDRAIAAALTEYREAKAEYETLDSEPAPDDAAYQDHAHAMATYPN